MNYTPACGKTTEEDNIHLMWKAIYFFKMRAKKTTVENKSKKNAIKFGL